MNVSYFVSRFPHTTETFILRELNAVSVLDGVHTELFALFPPRGDAIVHPGASRWLPRVYRPRPSRVVRDFLWWLARHPSTLLKAIAEVVKGYIGDRLSLGRALVTVPIACSHARLAHDKGVDHVHAHYATYPALAAWICRALTGIPYSLTVHAHDLYLTQAMLSKKVGDAQFVVAISEYNRRLLLGVAGQRTPIEVVHCGIDISAYPFRPRVPTQGGSVEALCVGSLQEYKGHRVLLEALARGGRALARINLTLVGDGPLRRSLEALARELGLHGRVSFLGQLPESDVIARLAEADLFVLPSVVAATGQMEGLPVVLVEALACGVPVVATRLSGIPELVTEGVGLLVEPGDVESLRRGLERVVNGEETLCGTEGRRRVEEEFDLRQSAERLKHLFERGARGDGTAEPPLGRVHRSPSPACT